MPTVPTTVASKPSPRLTPKERSLRIEFREVESLVKALSIAGANRTALRKSAGAERTKLADLWLEDSEAAVWRKLLQDTGEYYRTSGGDLLYFRGADRCLYDITQTSFALYLIEVTGWTEGRVRHTLLPRLLSWTRFEATEVTPHFLAYNDSPDLNVIALNTFDGSMMRRRRGQEWERVPNGTDNVLFMTPPEFLTPWTPKFSKRPQTRDLDWLCALGHFSDDGPLSVDDQRWLMKVWLLHLFLPAVNPVHLIPLHEGITGSGKTVAAEAPGRWLMGGGFEVMDLPSGDSAKAEESIKLALCKRPLVVIDNVDSPAPWCEDFLARYATGVRMSRRRLYTNSDEVHFTPRAGLILTSRTPHFRREDVARRLLPLRFCPFDKSELRTGVDIRAEVDRRRNHIWGDILGELARVQDTWLDRRDYATPVHSAADFSVFAQVVAKEERGGSVDKARARLARLEIAQLAFTASEDPLVELLQAVLSEQPEIPEQPVSQFYGTLKQKAQTISVPWPYSKPALLTQALKHRRLALESALGARIVLSDRHRGGVNHVAITTMQPADPGRAGRGGRGDSNIPLSEVEPRPRQETKKLGSALPSLPDQPASKDDKPSQRQAQEQAA